MVFPIARRVRHGFEQNEKMPRKWQRPLCRCGSTGTATGEHMPTLWGRRSLEMNRIIRRCPRLACEIICKLYIENSKVLSWGGPGGGAEWSVKTLKTLKTLNTLRHPGDFAWEWRKSHNESGDSAWEWRHPHAPLPRRMLTFFFRELATVSHGIAAPAWKWRQSCTESPGHRRHWR